LPGFPEQKAGIEGNGVPLVTRRTDVLRSFKSLSADGIHELPLRIGQMQRPQLSPLIRFRFRAPVRTDCASMKKSDHTHCGADQSVNQWHSINAGGNDLSHPPA
jgi:hypothetical protein